MKLKIEWWFGILTLLPAFAVASVYTEAFLASRSLDHWPIPSREDPKALVTAPLHLLSQILVLSVFPGVVVLTAVLAKNRHLLRNPSRYWVWISIFVLSFMLQLWLEHDDPRTWKWWWD